MSARIVEQASFHLRRAEQERRLANCATSIEVKAIHLTLSRLHETTSYELLPVEG